MCRHPRLFVLALCFVLTVGISAQEAPEYVNLKVLDPDISREELGIEMVRNTTGLGLPRRQREGCLHCHVGDMEAPVSEWDFPSDEKEMKLKARAMMRMVAEINEKHLANIEGRRDENLEVTCETCHAGRTDPRPLPVVLSDTYLAQGIDAAISKYDELRDRYYGAGAYDFRSAVLSRLAYGISETGAFDDALALASRNEQANPDSLNAAQTRLTLEVSRRISEDSAESALSFFEAQRQVEEPRVADYSVLDGLAWYLNRQGQVETSMNLFRSNLQLFPDEYITNESLGDALWFSGDREGGIEVFEAWVSEHPDDDMGRRRLLNMKDELAAEGR
jgi:tetratricopeptide (TPR) repeat protein